MPSMLLFSCLVFSTALGAGVAVPQEPVTQEPVTQRPVTQRPPAVTPPPPAVEAAPTTAAEMPHYLVRRYPEDKDVPVAIVGARTLTLGDLVDHLDKRHHPGFKEALLEQPKRGEIHRMLQSDLMAPWVRHLADLEALQQTFAASIDAKKLEAAQSEALKRSFQGWLDTYLADRKAAGRPTELTQAQINGHLARFQLMHGMVSELQGCLELLEPGDYNRTQLQNFFNANARAFGGQVTIEHILIQHRDAGTGLLLNEERMGLANARIADVKARLSPDGANFAEVARARSDDVRTAKDGGRLQGLHRYDERMPAALCRAAWNLRDGETSDVVETQYGWHLIKRIDFIQQVFILFTDDAMPTIKSVMQRAMQEDRLFAARQKTGVRLLL